MKVKNIKIKKRYLLLIAYLAIVALVSFSSLVLAKYVSEGHQDIDFTVDMDDSLLYFNYERSALYKNNELVSITTNYTENSDEIYLIPEEIPVIPGDSLTYYFFVSNFNSVNSKESIVDGSIYPNANLTIKLPSENKTYTPEYTIYYRQVKYDDTDPNSYSTDWTILTADNYVDLPVTTNTKVKYEFKLFIEIDDTMDNTTHSDYYNATLAIKVFINGASD